LHPLVGQALIRRGITSTAAARAFILPDYYNPTPAAELPGLSAAVDRVHAAIHAHEPVCVWGDFDVDGQTATTILVTTLQGLGADVTYYIPVRARESHGVNIPVLDEVISRGAKLILTCDTGISAHEAVEFTRLRGVEMIISDHHDLPETLPPAVAVVNPKLLPHGHPLSTLSGAGVAYKIVEALLEPGITRHTPPVTCLSFLDLVALGLVADLAALTGDTRYLVQRGLQALRTTERLGLQLMLELAQLTPAHLTEEHIGFTLAPRLNALGRLSDANPAVELLTTRDPVRARLLATQLEGLNSQRQLLTRQVTQAAEAQLRADPALLEGPVIILAHPNWPGGVIGLAASHLAGRYRRPVILFSSPPGEPARGSARSVEGINISQAIASQREMLLGFGGHPMAAGLSLEAGMLPAFRKAISKTITGMSGAALTEMLQIDGWFPLNELDLRLCETIEQVAPFGPGNEKLTLATRNLSLQSIAEIGRNKEHLKLTVVDERGCTQAVLWWNGGCEEHPDLAAGSGRFDLAYTLRASDFHGTPQVTLEFVDLRWVEEKPVEILKPRFEILDHRCAGNPHEVLGSLKLGNKPLAIWAEGDQKKVVGGVDRDGLKPTKTLVIWTIPPGNGELRRAVDIVKPEKIHLFAISPTLDEPKAFLERLMGLVKFSIRQRGGTVTLAELAAACAQRETCVRLGLEWLVAGGMIGLSFDEGRQMHLTEQKGQANPFTQHELLTALKGLLEETAAYRLFFTRAESDAIIT